MCAQLGQAVNAVWTTNYNGSGINGLLCTDKTDSSKTLFFPAAGSASYGSMGFVGDGDLVWSSSLNSGNGVNYAWYLDFSDGDTDWGNSDPLLDFEAYRALYLGNRKWQEGDDQISVGDEVILHGQLTKYGTTYETAQNAAYICSLNGRTE